MNANGTNIRRVGEGIPMPLFSPDGSKLSFTRKYHYSKDTDTIALVISELGDNNRSYQTEIHKDSGAIYSWCFSLDEKQLYFSKIGRTIIRKGEPLMKGEGIYVMNSDRSNLRRLTKERVMSSLVLTADGKRILYVKDNNLYSITTDGSDSTQITSNELFQFGFAMAPDRRHILFLSYPDLVNK